MVSAIILIIIMALAMLSVIATISQVGKERKPVAHEQAIGNLIVNGLVVAGLLYILMKGLK